MSNSPFIEDISTLQGEQLSLKYVSVDAIPTLLWAENPKLHDIGELWESIVKFGFIDPAKYDIKLTNKQGSKGALIFGNGRSEALWWGYQEFKAGRYEGSAPRGIGIDNAGAWYMPVKVGIDSNSEAAAADFGILHNTSTMKGGDFADGDIWRLFDTTELLKVGRLILQDDEFDPMALTGEEIDALLTFVNSPNNGSNPPSQSTGAGKTVICPHCGEEFTA